MMKDVEFSCMQKFMIGSELFSYSAEDIFWREICFGGEISSCATQYHAFFMTKTIQLVQSQREDRLKNR